jgi:intein/homing endonuclease
MSVLNYCHYNLGKIIPDYKPPEGLSGDKFEGAIVLPPNIGMHKWIASLDIASLYPSTMRSLNISPETITGQFIEGADAYKEIFEESDKDISFKEEKSGKFYTAPAKKWKKFLKKNNWTVSGCGTTFHQDYDGVIPSILTQWFTERKEYKKKMFEASQRGDKEAQEYYDNMQYIKKIQLNSMYGATGNKYFKFYDVRLAKSTTLPGREILMHMVKKVAEKLNGSYEWPSKSIYYGDSVAHDTKIYIAPDHDVKISELFTSVDDNIGDREYCYPKNVNVLTYSESKNSTVFRPIKYVMRHKCNKKMYRVHLNNYQYVDVTEDHSLIGYKNTKYRKKNESHLVELKPTELGDTVNSVVYLQNIPRESDNIESRNYSKEVYEFLGYVIGDGYCGPIAENGQHAGVGLSVGVQDISEVETKLLNPLKNQGLVTSWHIKSNGHDVRICGTAIARLVRQSLYADECKKSIPSWLRKESKENICAFLRGYFSADGTLTKGMPVLCSTNSEYLEEVQKLLFLCGISSTICRENNVNSYNGVNSGTYTKRLAVKQRDIFAERIGFILERKQNKINTKTGRYFSYQSKFDFAIQQVQKIEEIEYTDYVYDIEVEDTHTFFANNVLVHNTDSVYFHTRATTKEKSRMIANKLCDIVNESYPGFMRDAFNCDDHHDKLIKAEQEIVSDRGIFIKKKYYILHLVSKDGKDVDEMKNMGVPIKKTTLPKEIKIELESYIERLLKGESWDIIGPEIVAYKDKIKNLDNPLVLGLPTGVKKVEYYTELFNNNDPDLKSLPGHVAASILWNKSLNVYGDKESPKIISGSKIKVFYLKNKIDRFKSIAVPKELSEPPEWFLKHFEPIIDKDAQIERLVDNPMKIMISAAGLKVPTKKKILFEKVFE